MRILLIHAEELWYKTHKPAVKNPPDPPSEYSAKNATVAYISVEKGDTKEVVQLAAEEILEYAKNVVKSDSIVLYPYAHLSSNLERPAKAHSILLLLEKIIKEKWDKDLHRAPFGWYKEFKLHAKGHPLSELSRTITAENFPLRYKARGKSIALTDAIAIGFLPKCVGESKLSFKGLSSEKMKMFGLIDFENWMSRSLVERLARRIETLVKPIEHYTQRPFTPPINIHKLNEIKYLYREADSSEENTVVGAPEPTWIIKTKVNLQEFLEEVNSDIRKNLMEIPLCGEEDCLDLGVGGTLIYYANQDLCLPLGIIHEEYTLVGPLGNIARAIVDFEAHKAETEDYTPRLPVWLHPVTVYVIPVGDKVRDFVVTIVRELVGIGANVIVDETTKSVGVRVRKAGKLWVPYIVTIGDREVETGTVTVRRRVNPGTQEALTISDFISEVKSLLSLFGVSGSVRYLT